MLPFYAALFSVLYATEVARHPTLWTVVLAIGICAGSVGLVIDRLHERRARINAR